MLQHAAERVAPGGRLIYATCSSEPEENEGVADAFLATHAGVRAGARARGAHPLLADALDRRTRASPDRSRIATASKRSSARCSNAGGEPSRNRSPGTNALRCLRAPRLNVVVRSLLLMALRTRVWSAGKLLLLGGALVATYVLFAAASMRVALRAREVQVPDFTNRTANEASAIAADLGLTLKVDDTRRLDPKIAAGRVLAQEPAAGSTARRQRSVRVWLSAGQRASTVPGLVGETERTAQLRLAQDGLTLADIAEIRSQAFMPDVVVAQTPPAKDRAGTRRAARQPRRARRELRDARPHRRQRRSRRRHPARPRLPRRRRRLDAVSRRRRRHRAPPEPAGGLPDRARASRSRSR